MVTLNISERLNVYTRYIGQQLVLKSENDEQLVKLTGVSSSAIQVLYKNQNRWIPLYQDFDIYEIKLLLKPLRLLTDQIKETANSLPVQNFITQYYVQLGFDMPMFFAPNHPGNCMYVAELGLAVYADEYTEQTHINKNSLKYGHLTVQASFTRSSQVSY
jgi:hypothetical protein